MKIKALIRVSLRSPSLWIGDSADGRAVEIRYHHNRLSIKAGDEAIGVEDLPPSTSRSSGYLSDQQLVRMVAKHFPEITLPKG